MNYYNPYLFTMPSQALSIPKTGGIFSRIFGSTGLKLGSFLNGTQKVLNFTNQLIPVVKQVQPMIKNAKTMFRVMNEFKKTDNTSSTSVNNIKEEKVEKKETLDKNYNQGPTFFA